MPIRVSKASATVEPPIGPKHSHTTSLLRMKTGRRPLGTTPYRVIRLVPSLGLYAGGSSINASFGTPSASAWKFTTRR